MVGLELVELHFEVRRRQDVRQDHGVEVHRLLVAPQRQHVALLARHRRLGDPAAAARRLLLGRGRGRLVLRLRVARQRGAVVSHVAAEGRREGQGGGGGQARSLFGTTVRDPTPWNAVGRGGRLAVPRPGDGRATRTPTNGLRVVESKRRGAARENSRRKTSRRPGSTISSANCPWEQDGGSADVTPQAPEFQASPAANQRRPGGVGGPGLFRLPPRVRCALQSLRAPPVPDSHVSSGNWGASRGRRCGSGSDVVVLGRGIPASALGTGTERARMTLCLQSRP